MVRVGSAVLLSTGDSVGNDDTVIGSLELLLQTSVTRMAKRMDNTTRAEANMATISCDGDAVAVVCDVDGWLLPVPASLHIHWSLTEL